ncbi:MAG: carboxylesterase family protein, partial [Nitriliruptoraceae bacterium]
MSSIFDSSGSVTVDTDTGKFASVPIRGAHAFLGIPYGESCADTRRFRAPLRRFARGDTAVVAGAYGPSCPPTYSDADRLALKRSPYWKVYSRSDVRAAEDCLVLNVWTPTPDQERRSVLVWVHGGGYSWGSGASQLTDGSVLARDHNLVVVSVNHRLGALGFLGNDHAALDGGGTIPGVVGMLDLVMALQWVRSNIRQFGGDPDAVTIAGHSGGAAKIATLLAMPASRGLFRRAMLMGGPGSVMADDLEAAAQRFVRIVTAAGVSGIEGLRRLPVEQLLEAARGEVFRPVVEGEVLAHHPATPEAAFINPIPVLMGTTTDETAAFKSFDAAEHFAGIDDAMLMEIVRD